ncbi:hypothetical protein CDAR_402981 [Caerostris darwini]|uniref:Uncharacterized protein n=1 Tax=Caerostris darwini TaxID=1538125 RepID=A0AAV4X148_9ARAC|nr:hypothetical protein CDAR_402981 [Caerostris darwini]
MKTLSNALHGSPQQQRASCTFHHHRTSNEEPLVSGERGAGGDFRSPRDCRHGAGKEKYGRGAWLGLYPPTPNYPSPAPLAVRGSAAGPRLAFNKRFCVGTRVAPRSKFPQKRNAAK